MSDTAVTLYADLTTAEATVVVSIIDDTELPWGHTMDGLRGMYYILPVTCWLQSRWQEFGGMAYLQGNILGWQLPVDAVEADNGEVLLISCLRVVAMRYVDDVLLNVFLDDKPRSTTESHTFALSDGVEPVAAMLANLLACFQFDDVARLFTEIATDIVVVVDLAQEADAL